MSDQNPGRSSSPSTPQRTSRDEPGERTDFGASGRSTRGTDRDLDRSGASKNQGHGHPREERDRQSER